jgi:hypothetical protein
MEGRFGREELRIRCVLGVKRRSEISRVLGDGAKGRKCNERTPIASAVRGSMA